MSTRPLDALAALGGLVVLSPLLIGIALAVKLSSPGPVLFRQVRVGRHGRTFRIAKFRSMVTGAEGAGPRVTAAADRRITPLGAWLRRHKLDELPQLWNVLVGDMALVGPRPEVPEYVRLYPPEMHQLVLSVRPGITDPAAIAFLDEESLLAGYPDPERAYREVVLPRKLALYADYVRTRTVWSDLGTILRTLGAILGAQRPPA